VFETLALKEWRLREVERMFGPKRDEVIQRLEKIA
jgi:hypothetical protein